MSEPKESPATEPIRIDYRRMDYEHRQHYERRKRYVEANGLVCQDCGGVGQYVEEWHDYWPRYEMCGWCEGTGKVTRWERGMWLRYKQGEKP